MHRRFASRPIVRHRLTALVALLCVLCGAALAGAAPKAKEPHRCAGAAREAALKLLRLHADGDERASVEGDTRTLKPVKAVKGKAKYDVVEVNGFVYKAAYRVRVLFMQGGESCTRMGMEIVEVPAGG